MGEIRIEPYPQREILSISEASEHLGFHKATLRRWADKGILPHFRTPGGQRRFYRDELDAFLQSLQPRR